MVKAAFQKTLEPVLAQIKPRGKSRFFGAANQHEQIEFPGAVDHERMPEQRAYFRDLERD